MNFYTPLLCFWFTINYHSFYPCFFYPCLCLSTQKRTKYSYYSWVEITPQVQSEQPRNLESIRVGLLSRHSCWELRRQCDRVKRPWALWSGGLCPNPHFALNLQVTTGTFSHLCEFQAPYRKNGGDENSTYRIGGGLIMSPYGYCT